MDIVSQFVRFYGVAVFHQVFLHVQSVCWRFWYQRFLQILFCCCYFVGLQFYQVVYSGSLCLSKFWVLEHCFGFFGLVCQRFQGLNVGGFLRVWFFSLRGLDIK